MALKVKEWSVSHILHNIKLSSVEAFKTAISITGRRILVLKSEEFMMGL